MPRPWTRLLLTLHVAAMTVLLARLPRSGDPTDLDHAWQGLLQHDWRHGARHGVESVFTYGPLGFLFAPATFTAEDLGTRTLLALAVALVVALSLLAPWRWLPTRGARATYLLTLLLLAPYLEGSAVFVALAALGIAAARALGDDAAALGATRPVRSLLAFTAVAAAAGMAKFTWFALAVGILTVLTATAAARRRPAFALLLPLAATVAFGGLWLAVGQRLADLPTWLHASIEIAAGYNDGMASDRDAGEREVALALLAAALVLAAALFAVARREGRRPLPMLAAIAVALGALFATWKAGFVRHDESHTVMYFGFVAVLPLLLVAAVGARALPTVLRTALVATTLTAAWQLVAATDRIAGVRPFADALQRTADLLRPTAFAARIERELAAVRATPPLPRLRARVGDAAIDLLGHQQGLLFASGFTVRHRPVFQGYSAYTPWLQQQNGAFFRGANAPPFVLAAVQSLGGRLPMTEDSDAWRALLAGYRPVATERGVLLLARRDDVAGDPPPRRVAMRAQFGAWIELPPSSDHRDLALELTPTWIGRAFALLYRSPRLALDVRLRDGSERTFPVSSLLVRAPFPLDPLVRDARDFVAAMAGTSALRVTAFRLRAPAAAALLTDDFEVQIEAHAPPRADPSGDLAAVATALAFPGFEWPPFAADGEGIRPVGKGEDGVLAPPPSTLRCRWPGGAHRLVVRFELLAGSWTGAARTDGAVFRVEVGDGDRRRELAERALAPADRPADRGLQTFELDLDLPPGEIVAFVTDAGPAGRSSYDLTAWRHVALLPR